jgi:hypothetical protein
VLGGTPRAVWGLIATAITVIAPLAITATSANAATTRAEYVAQAEVICKGSQKPTFKAYNAFFKGLSRLGLEGEEPNTSRRAARAANRLLGVAYLRISNIYDRSTSRLAALTAAQGDEAAVASWLGGRREAAALGARAGHLAKHQKLKRAIHMADRASSISENAVKSVADYGFHYCALSWGEAES